MLVVKAVLHHLMGLQLMVDIMVVVVRKLLTGDVLQVVVVQIYE